jgi:hypothetical protein
VKKLIVLLIVTLLLASFSAGQNSSLTGKVFAITRGGDVKPALLAFVYLYPTIPSHLIFINWLKSHIINEHEFEEKMILIANRCEGGFCTDPEQKREIQISLKKHCREFLADVDKMNDEMNTDRALLGPAYIDKTDETGSFKITRIKAGEYFIIVRGQAGPNDVLWFDKLLIVSGTNTVKLSSVVKACQSSD